MATGITIETVGRRVYIIGNTFAIKDQIRDAGAKWDADRKAWYVGTQRKALADQIVAQAGSAESSDRKAPGVDSTVAGRVEYKGRAYYVAGRVERGDTHWDDSVSGITSRDGSKILLYSRDGAMQFWADRELVAVLKRYDKPQTISGLQRFAERAKEARAQGYEDGIGEGQTYECEECGERVTRGQGSCWETGAAH